MASIRGAAIGSFVSWYATAHGRGSLEAALAAAGTDRHHLDPRRADLGFRPTQWYPAPFVHRMLDVLLANMTDDARAAVAEGAARHTVEAALQGWPGLFARSLGSPRLCAMFGPTFWRAFYDSGRVAITPDGGRTHVMTVSAWDGHHDFLCRLNSASGRWIYRAVGSAEVSTVRTGCVSRGDRHCAYVIRW